MCVVVGLDDDICDGTSHPQAPLGSVVVGKDVCGQ